MQEGQFRIRRPRRDSQQAVVRNFLGQSQEWVTWILHVGLVALVVENAIEYVAREHRGDFRRRGSGEVKQQGMKHHPFPGLQFNRLPSSESRKRSLNSFLAFA